MTVVTDYIGLLRTDGLVFGNMYIGLQHLVAGGRVEVGEPKDYSMFTCSHSNTGHTTHRMDLPRDCEV
jgi:hypothetical protein